MIDGKQIEESRNVIKNLIINNEIVKPSGSERDFFIKKSENAIETARILLEVSKNDTLRKELNTDKNFESYTWIINAAYYSMFYAATSLLAHFGHKIKSGLGIHTKTFHALVYYFLDCDNKLPKYFVEHYQEISLSAEELLQISEERARTLIGNVKNEMNKRKEFTYDMGKFAEESKAMTSITRARDFITVVTELIGNKLK